MTSATIRPAIEADLPAITAIYTHHVLNSSATFELTPPPVEEMARRRQALMDKGLPWLVAEYENEIVGYAYAGPYRARPAYDWTLEDSIYIRHDRTGQGLGRILLEAVIARCCDLGYRQMIAVIGDSANTGSISLHQACGFYSVGVFKSAGWKFGRWIDSVLMQRPLGVGDGQPAPR